MAGALITLGVILAFFVLVFFFFFPLGRGAVWVASSPGKAVRMAALAGAAPGRRVADLGSGDGRVLIALARRGAEAHGFEVNPLLVLVSRRRIRRASLRGQAFVHWKSFWRADFSRFDALTVFQGSFVMRRLERKIRREARPGARIVSDFWAFPTLAPRECFGTLYRYTVGGAAGAPARVGTARPPAEQQGGRGVDRARRLLSVSCALLLFGISGAATLCAQGSSPGTGGSPATYTNRQYSFTLQYPKDLVPVSGGDTWSTAASLNGGPRQGTAIVTITVFDVNHDSAKPYPYPLFFSAWVSVGVSPDTADCYEGMASERGTSTPRDVTIGGLPFKVGTSSDAGMMKYTNVTSYRIIHDGACYAVDQVEHGSSYQDENTLPGLSDDQLQAWYDEAGTIARSFRFTDAVPR